MTPPCPFTWMLSPPGYSKVSGGPDSMVLAIGKGKVPAGIRWEHRIWAWERHSGIRAYDFGRPRLWHIPWPSRVLGVIDRSC